MGIANIYCCRGVKDFIKALYAHPLYAHPLSSAGRTSEFLQSLIGMRLRRFFPMQICIVGGCETDQSVESFEPIRGTWDPLPKLLLPRGKHAVATLDGRLYVIGGYHPESQIELASVECFDPNSRSWSFLPPMHQGRISTCAVGLGGCMYVIGGEGHDGDPLDSVECFDSVSHDWYFLPPLLVGRDGAGACTLDGRLFVFGGGDLEGVPLDSMECLQPGAHLDSVDFTNSTWTQAPPMNRRRFGPAAAVVRQTLYVFGGQDHADTNDVSLLASAECFNFQANVWFDLPAMSCPRNSCCAAALDDLTYVFGGETENSDGENSVLASVERYNPETGKWRAMPQMNHDRVDFGCGCIQVQHMALAEEALPHFDRSLRYDDIGHAALTLLLMVKPPENNFHEFEEALMIRLDVAKLVAMNVI